MAEEAGPVLATGQPKLTTYGVSDETAWSVGLSCGGRIEIFIESLSTDLLDVLRDDALSVRVVALAGETIGRWIVIGSSGSIVGSLGSPELDSRAIEACHRYMDLLSCGRETIEAGGSKLEAFVDLMPPRPKLVIIGAVHVAIHLVALARRLGYWTAVIDPRTVFATPERFAEADALLTDWPQDALAKIALDQTTCLVFLSHDLKIDLPGLAAALRSRALYIGALGSRKTHAKRLEALQELGFSQQECHRISAPVGLDLGGRRAEEIALAIMAEIVAVRYGGKVLRS